MEILFGSRMLTECEQTPGIDVDPLQTLTDGVIIFLTEAEAPGLRRSFVRIMQGRSQGGAQGAFAPPFFPALIT